MKNPIALWGLFVAFLSLRCADKIISECNDDKKILHAKTGFQTVQREVFTPRCALEGCHAGSEPTSSLNLEAGQSYGNLVNVRSLQDPARMRVLPGHSNESYLIDKLTKANLSIMPPTGQLQNAVIDSIAAWIDRGALK
jgi:hypothetical protein